MSSIIQNKFHEILGDMARTSKFIFILPVLGGNPDLANQISYAVKGCTLPKISHDPIKIMHKGRPIPIRGTTRHSQEFSVTFYELENLTIKRFFEEWMSMIEQRHYYVDPRKMAERQRKINGSSGKPQYMTWYNTDAWVEQRNFDGDKVTAVHEIKNVFPINVEFSAYDYSQVGQIGETSVTFACSHHILHSRPLHNGNLQNQLFYTTQKQRDFKEYGYEVDRWKTFNDFHNLDQTENQRQEIYWRPYELARWDNNFNRWRENLGENKSPGKDPAPFDPDNI